MLAHFSIKWFMVCYLGALLVVGSVVSHAPERLLAGLAMIAIYAAADVLWTYARDRTWYLPLSSLISGLILALVAVPNPRPTLLFALPLIAVASKQLLRFGRIRHLINPAGLALGVTSLIVPSVSWWGASFHPPETTYTLLLFGLFILWRIKRFPAALTFIAIYTVFVAVSLGLTSLPGMLGDGTLLFFSTIMLVEPMTTTLPTRRSEIVYGALVAGILILLTTLSARPPLGALISSYLPYADPLLLALIFGNLIAGLVFLPRKIKMAHS